MVTNSRHVTDFLVFSVLLATVFSSITANASSPENVDRAATAAGTGSGADENNSGLDRVYLRSITALIFSENGRARSQNGPGKPQLRCVGGSASGFFWFSDYYPHVVQCRNIGWDGASIQWSCEGQLNKGIAFGPDTQVICEPYDDDKSDGYVLRGSCRLEYTLNFTTFQISFVHVVYGAYWHSVSCRDVTNLYGRR